MLRHSGAITDMTGEPAALANQTDVSSCSWSCACNPDACVCAASMMEATNHEVELGGAEPEIIELLVEFVYTAR